MPEVLKIAGSGGMYPLTGPRNLASRSPRISNAPNATAPTDSRITGQVITGGASCGWALSSQRRFPANVMNMTRVM